MDGMNREEIQHLDQREQARDKLSIWFGGRENYLHGLREVMANATDEIINNFDEGVISVELLEDQRTIIIEDTGRGIGMTGDTNGTPNYELLFKILFAGTKYNSKGSEGTFTGLNGLGNTVLNYTSVLFDVTSRYGGQEHHIRFENGGDITQELTSKDMPKAERDRHGTRIEFRLDPEMYTEVEYTSEEVKDIARRYSVSSPRITVEYKHGDESEEFHYESSKDYFDEMNEKDATSSTVHGRMINFDIDGEETSMELSLATATEPVQESYLNLTYLPSGGTINQGVINGTKLFMNKHCRDNKLFPKGVRSFSDIDVEESLSFLAVMFSSNADFEGQTKFLTNKELYFEVAKRRTQQLLEVAEIEDRENFDKIVKHLLIVQEDNTVNKKQKDRLKKAIEKEVNSLDNRVEKLKDSEVHGEEAELYLAEGDSAHGAISLARKNYYQASMPMGGKFLNVLKLKNINDITNNEIVMNVIRAIGAGVDLGGKQKDIPKFNIDNMRYGKIIIASDQDPDGMQIQNLIITLFYVLMPEIIKKGKLFIAQTPLYEVKTKGDDILYIYSESEYESLMDDGRDDIVSVDRAKGLGQLDSDVLRETALDEETRSLIEVKVGDVKKAEDSLDNWMGNVVSYRKEYLSNNLHKYLETVLEEG